MPQMSPLMWMNLMIMFSMIMMTMNSTNYFQKLTHMNFSKKLLIKTKNWKW